MSTVLDEVRLESRHDGVVVGSGELHSEPLKQSSEEACEQEAPDSVMSERFGVGDLAIIHGLQSEAGKKLNGQGCELVAFECVSQRWCVRLDPWHPKAECKKLQTQNLRLVNLSQRSRSGVYRIKPIRNRGFGIVAERAISQGQVLIEEEPILETRSKRLESQIRGLEIVIPEIQKQFESLPGPVKQQYMDLDDRYARNHDGKTVCNIFRTNNLSHCTTDGGAVFLEMSRINHCCLGNAEFVPKSPQVGRTTSRVYAVRDIAKGDEICISYIRPWLCKEERQKMLNELYGFSCKCTACCVADSSKSDDNRRRLQELCTKYSKDELPGTSAKQVVDECLEALRLIDEEGLSIPLHEAHLYESLLLVYEMQRMWESAAHAAAMALTCARPYYGHAVSRIRDLEQKLELCKSKLL